ncbi:hypothetical protein ACHAPJ_007395 [Fusarium lateritium]
MPDFPYTALDLASDSIRLLQIHKGWWSEDISCSLFVSFPNPAQGSPYKALSYTWGGDNHVPGGSENLPRVWVNEKQFELRANLFSALRHIRRDDRDVLLWTDAICINQDDDDEKGHQVNLMGDIYTAAEEVLIWLGPSNADTESLMESISWIDSEASNAYKCQAKGNRTDWTTLCHRFAIQRLGGSESQSHSRQGQALAELLHRKWFSRVWILQEVAMAKTARVLCGSYSCPARTFGVMPMLLELEVDPRAQAVLDIMPRLRQNTWWSSRRYLHNLLVKFAASEATDKRDKVYALLSMSEDAHDRTRFFPDYNKTESQVFQDTASFLIFGEIISLNHSLPILSAEDLSLPIIQLAEKILLWALGEHETEVSQESAQRTSALLISRMKEGQLKTQDLLLSLAERKGQLGQTQNLMSHGKVDFDVYFEDEQSVLSIRSVNRAIERVNLVFPRKPPNKVVTPAVPDSELSFCRFEKDENMTETINRLVETGSPKEELMWAYVWAGNMDGVQRLLEEGVDVNSSDDQGHTAIHFAILRGHFDVMSLLSSKGADQTKKDNHGKSPFDLALLALGGGSIN